MKITTKVTKRDIMLLIILGVFLVAAGLLWFVIRPINDQILSIRGEIDALRMQADLYQMQSSQLADKESQKQSAKETYESLLESFLTDTTEEDISRLVVDTITAHGGTMQNFRIAKDEGSTDDNGYAGFPAYGEDLPQDDSGFLEGVYSYTVSAVISGDKENLQSLIDLWTGGGEVEIEEGEIAYPQIFISSFSWKDGDNSKADTTDSVLTINLRIFTIQPVEGEEN
jgi:hypothetical protein